MITVLEQPKTGEDRESPEKLSQGGKYERGGWGRRRSEPRQWALSRCWQCGWKSYVGRRRGRCRRGGSSRARGTASRKEGVADGFDLPIARQRSGIKPDNVLKNRCRSKELSRIYFGLPRCHVFIEALWSGSWQWSSS